MCKGCSFFSPFYPLFLIKKEEMYERTTVGECKRKGVSIYKNDFLRKDCKESKKMEIVFGILKILR